MITGVLESIERDEAKSLIERYGGKVTGNVSKKTNYLVMGRDSGQSKRDKVGAAVFSAHGNARLFRQAPGVAVCNHALYTALREEREK